MRFQFIITLILITILGKYIFSSASQRKEWRLLETSASTSASGGAEMQAFSLPFPKEKG